MRRRILIINRTHWSTVDLRRFIVRAARDVFGDEARDLHVTFVYSRGDGRFSGRASIGGGRSRIRLPRTETPNMRHMLAAMLVHELMHNRGARDRRGGFMQSAHRIRTHEQFAWGNALPLAKIEAPKREPVVGLALAEKRRALVAAGIDRWTAKERRARTALRKLRARLRYYDRRMAAMSAPTE